MATPYEDLVSQLSGGFDGQAAAEPQSYDDLLASTSAGLTKEHDPDDWWGNYWGHLKDQASAAYHATNNNETPNMPSTDPMTLTKLIGDRASYLSEIDAGSDPNADVDTKTKSATAAKRLARIDSVLSLMAGQAPADPMTPKKADDVVQGLTHEQLMASDRYKQVYDSTSTDMMGEDQRRDYARDVIAKETSDLPYQRDSILAQVSGQDASKALEQYGVTSLPARQSDFYLHHDSDVPLPSSLQGQQVESAPGQSMLDQASEAERVGVEHLGAGLHGMKAVTNVIVAAPAAMLYDALASQFGGDTTAAQDWVFKNLVDPDTKEAAELRAGAIPHTVAEKVTAMAGDMAPAFAMMFLTKNPEAAALVAPADMSALEQAMAQIGAQMQGASTVAIPTTTEAALERAREGDAPSTGEFLSQMGENIAFNTAPMAAGGPLPSRLAQGGAAQAALVAGQQVAAGAPVDPGDLAAAAIVGAGFGAMHAEPFAKTQTPADVTAARGGYQSEAHVKAEGAARSQWEGKFAKVLDQMGDDPEAKARADYALTEFNEGRKSGLWAMSELHNIAKTGKTRDEEAYAATRAAESDVGQALGETPASVAGEVQSEKAAAAEVFDEPVVLNTEDLTAEERASFERQQEHQPLDENNASGESAASLEAQGRVRDETEAGQHRVVIERDGTVIPLHGVDAVDTHARAGQVVAQRGIGENEWTILSHGDDMSKMRANGQLNAAKPHLDELVAERAREREGVRQEAAVAAGENTSAGVSENETARARVGNVVAGEARPTSGGETVDVDSAAHAAETSTLTEGQPSESKIAAGNYKKGHIKALGLDISVESPRGSTRSGVSPDGRSWSRTMNHHYGYIRGTVGADGGHMDVLLGDQPHNPTRQVFVVDQMKPDGTFDEHKVLMGFRSQKEAERAYLSEYPKGWGGKGRVRAMTAPEFKSWVRGAGRDEAATGPVADAVPRITLRHQQADATTVHASAATEGTSAVANGNGFDGQPLTRLSLENAGMPSRRRTVLAEVPRGAPVQAGHSSAVLRNVYDLGRDPRSLMQKARAEVEQRGLPVDEDHVINEFERQVVANGFDGYRSEGHVTVLGHDVPVARSEGETHGDVQQRVEARPEETPAPAASEGLGDAGRASESDVGDQGAKPAGVAGESADQRESAPAPKKVKPAPYSGTGMSKSAVHGLVKLLKWDRTKGKIVVHQTEAELPSHLQDNIDDDYRGRVHGLYDPTTGKVHIVADQMTSPRELYRTLTEEHLGHGGLRKIFNEADLNTFLDRAWSNVPKSVREELAKQYGTRGKPLNLSVPKNRRTVAEEYFAKLDPMVSRQQKTMFEKFHDWFNLTSRKMGREVDYTPSELREIMRSAQDHQRAGLSPSHHSESPVDQVTPRFNLDGTSKVSDRTFYSALKRSLEAGKGMPKSGNAKAWKEWLDGAQRRGEFKQAEREWMGIDQFLDSADAEGGLFPHRISRTDIVNFARQHAVDLDETHLSNQYQEEVDAAEARFLELENDHNASDEEIIDARETWRDLRDSYDDSEEGSAKYGSYTLPGGWDYREILLQLPHVDEYDEDFGDRMREAGDGLSVRTIRRHGPLLRDIAIHTEENHPVRQIERFAGTDEEAIAEYRGEDTKKPTGQTLFEPKPQEEFQSGHFEQKNIVAHARMKERVGVDGVRVLHLEEIQSDWHQQGRKLGYGGNIADAPFKKEWPLLAFKRALRYAVDNHFERISWTTGAQQARRYNLADTVDKIRVAVSKQHEDNDPIGTVRQRRVYIDTLRGQSIRLDVDTQGRVTASSHDQFLEHPLSDVIGTDAAKQIMDVDKETEIHAGDLTMGGEGMKAFYDRILPNDVGKYVKQWGASVENKPVTNLSGFEHFEDMQDRNHLASHSVDITEKMRDSVRAGQPMFRIGRAKGTPEQEATMARTMARPPEDLTLGDRVRQWYRDLRDSNGRDGWEGFKQGMIDSGNQLARIEREIFGGFLGDASESAYKMYNLSKNSHAVMAGVMKVGAPEYRDGAFQPVDGRKGMFEIFRPLYEHEGGESLMPLWELYAVGLRASRLINETNINGTLREKNMTQEDIDHALALADKYPVFKKVADDFQEFNNHLLDLAADRGALSPEEAEVWKENFYVPFYRALEEMEFGGTSKVAKSRRGSAASNQKIYTRHLSGADRKVDNVFENILANTAYILDRTYRQEFMNRLRDMGEGTVLERVPMANKAVSVTTGDLARALGKLGISAGYATHGKFGSPHIQPSPHWAAVEVDNLSPADKQQWMRVFQRVAPTDPDIVPIMTDGKLAYYRVTDPLLLRTIGAMGHDSFGRLIGLFAGGKRLVTWGVTKDPGFMAATWFRDALINWVGSHTPITPFVDNVKGALDSIREDPLTVRLMTAGVGVAPHYETQGSTVRHQMQDKYGPWTPLGRIRAGLALYNRVGIAAEASSRIAIAKSVLERGGSMAEAAYQAQDILNYSMRGDYVAARVLAQTAPFWNAGMQGLYRFMRGAGVANAKAGDTSQLRSYMLRGSILVGATLANAWRNQDDPRYNRLTNDEKDRYWWFFFGQGKDTIKIKLPKPFEAGVIFGTLPERIVQGMLGNDTTRDSMRAALSAVVEEMRLNPLPQYIRQGVEQWANRDTASQTPIVPASMTDDLPNDQYSPYTHITARAVTKVLPEKLPWLNSPKRVESLVRGIVGTIGVMAMDAGDWLARASGLAPPAPTMRAQDVYVVKRVYGGEGEFGDRSQYEDKLYDLRETAKETYNSFQKSIQAGDAARAQELAGRPAFVYHDALEQMARTVSTLRGAERQIMQNPFIGPEEKRQQLDEARDARIKLLDQYGPLLNQLHDQF